MAIKFMKYAVKEGKNKVRVHYSRGGLRNYPDGTITIYAKDYGARLPKGLFPKNDTDIMTDYFDKDKARVTPSNKHYPSIRKLLGF